MQSMARPAQRGFSLVETLIALTILGVALLLGMSLLLQQPRVVSRLDAQRRALAELESTLEALRSGAIPLQSARLGPSSSPSNTPSNTPAVVIGVSPAEGPPGLYEVSLRAIYLVEGRTRERTLETLIWSPGP